VSEVKYDAPVARAAQKAFCETLLEGVIEPVRRVARDAGYAIAVHGSLAKDIDLVAIPWVEHNVSDPDYLAGRIAAVIAGQVGRCNVMSRGDRPKWEDKPHGRKSLTLLVWSALGGTADIDLSVMPRAEQPKADMG
jgi:hypothetical protein